MSTETKWPNWPTDWTPFVADGDDGDIIWVISTARTDGAYRVGLETMPTVTAFKQIRVLDGSGQEMATISTGDKEHGAVWVTLPTGWAQLEFVKAKIFGVHTGVYVTPPKGVVPLQGVDQAQAGWDLCFQWRKDHR